MVPVAPLPAAATEPTKALIIAGGVLAGAAAIAGGALAGVYASKGSSASSLAATIRATPPRFPAQPPGAATGNCATLKSDLDAKATMGTASVAAFVGAGAVGVATLIYGLAGGSRGAATGVVVAPVVTAEGGGVFVGGRF